MTRIEAVEDSRITLPWKWKPREYQRPVWEYLAGGGKRAVLQWARRHGKDDVLLHHAACAAHERIGTYWYCAPQFSQARKAFWEAIDSHQSKRRIDLAIPPVLRRRTREQEMAIDLHCGSTLQVIGSDNFDSLVGSPPVGIVFSEYALANPAAWGYLRPILLENGGWAAFNSTPRGKNHFKLLCEMAAKRMVTRADGSVSPEGWFHSKVTVDDSRLFTDEQLQAELSEMISEHGEDYGRALWLQEYWVSFDAAIPGSIFGDKMAVAEESGRIGLYEHEAGLPVFTGWDLGRTDATVIWWYQVFGGEVRFIDYHASNFKDVPFYADELQKRIDERGFRYGTNYLPHDARPRTLAAGGKSILQQFQEANKKRGGHLGKFVIAPRLDKQEQIQAARATLARACFDRGRCEDGIEALRAYHREWDPEKRVFLASPAHDWASHPSDALMTCAVTWKAAKYQREADGDMLGSAGAEALMRGSVGSASHSFGALKKQHLAKARAARSGLFTSGKL